MGSIWGTFGAFVQNVHIILLSSPTRMHDEHFKVEWRIHEWVDEGWKCINLSLSLNLDWLFCAENVENFRKYERFEWEKYKPPIPNWDERFDVWMKFLGWKMWNKLWSEQTWHGNNKYKELTMPKIPKKMCTKSGAVGLFSDPSSWPWNTKSFLITLHWFLQQSHSPVNTERSAKIY